jgi:protein-tyrosine-phosphatase
MAEAFLRDMAGKRFEVIGAGAEASTLDPDAVAVMDEAGLDISGRTSKKLTRSRGSASLFSLHSASAKLSARVRLPRRDLAAEMAD